jgi:hypothetical protein
MAALFQADAPVLADDDIYPETLPPGYAFTIDEPEFDPAIHLQLESPEQVWSLADIGYGSEAMDRFPSAVALTSPARILSPEGVAVAQHVARQLQPYIRHRPDSKRVPAVLRGTTHRSRFIRDLCLSKDITNFFSDMVGTPLMPHTVTHHQGHMNFAPKDLNASVDAWHHDSVAFDWVMMVHDPKTIRGGKFEVFMGTREEGARMVEDGGDPPADRIFTPDFPDAGYACYMQGCAVFHRATRVEEIAWRASLVQSYVARDVRFPDANRFYYTEDPASGVDPNSALERDVSEFEWAKHRAWAAKAKLDWFVKNAPYTTDPAQVVAWLEASVADVNDIVATIKRGRMSMSEALLRRAAEDALQTGTAADGALHATTPI